MASTLRVWLLVWVISDMMIFKMNAAQNSTQEINDNHNANGIEIKVNALIAHDKSEKMDKPEIIVELHNPNIKEKQTVLETIVLQNNSDSNEDHTNNSNEQTLPTIPPLVELALDNPDKIEKDDDHDDDSHNTTTLATPASTTTSNGTGNSTETAKKSLIPEAKVQSSIKHKSDTQQKIIISSVPDCPPLEDADTMTQTELIKRLVHVCRYDRLERPVSYDSKNCRKPVIVYARAYVYFMQNLDVHDLKFDIHLLFQVRYVDPRLVFRELSPNRKQPIVGRTILRQSLWSPHIFMANARATNILGTTEKDVLTSVSPDGTVIISQRIQASVNCWMNLQMYPFDTQKCKTIFESWMYNSSELELHWEEASPITIAPQLRLTEYKLMNVWTNETIVHADLSNLRHGAFIGNYSSLFFTLNLSREMGCFIMDYFLPSIMIVSLSWVSFWLRADAPTRITLGTSAMLTFITLSSAHNRTLPKVSYIKMSEVWFVVCCLFIFSSLIEFAFVNAIFRRNNKVDLKKVNTMHILKSSLTPEAKHKDLSNGGTSTCTKRKNKRNKNNNKINGKQHLTAQHINLECVPSITTTQHIDNSLQNNIIDVDPSANTNNADSVDPKYGWTTMTSQDIALWIDRRARVLFPFAFIVFNIVFWTVAYNA